jgi:urease beta subunit
MSPLSRRSLLACETLERRACPAVVAISPGFEIVEGDPARMLTVSLDAPAERPLTVSYALAGTATPGSDFRVLLDGRRIDMPLGRITFEPGEVQKQLAVVPFDDDLREGDESFTITLRPMGGVTIPPERQSATVTIIDNDTYDVQIEPLTPDGLLVPGQPNEFAMRLMRRGQVVAATRTERFYVSTRNGSAVAGTDYLPFERLPVTFGPGQTEQRFRLNVLPKGPNDFNAAFFIMTDRFESAAADRTEVRTVVVGPRGAPPPPSVSFTHDIVRLPEGNNNDITQFVFTVQLDVPSEGIVSVDYVTRDGTATIADGDYIVARGTLEFQPGERRKTVTVMVLGDRNIEGDEDFFLDLSNPQPDGVRIVQETATGIIVEDEIEQSGFQIDLVFADSSWGPVPEGVRSLAREAANRWSRIIVGNLPSVVDGRVLIDDFEMTVSMGLLGNTPNAPGGVLANARPTDFRGVGTGLPYRGEAGLDPFDVSDLRTQDQRNRVLDVITHEIGHALGFTGSASFFSRYILGDEFVGTNAIREYNALFRNAATGVPLAGGFAHWRYEVFGPELMSPFAPALGSRAYISRVTVGAFEDFGYQVNYAAAEPYVPPRRATEGIAGAPQGVPSLSGGIDLRQFVTAGDFNGNGTSDLVWRNADGRYVLELMRPTGGVARQVVLGEGGDWVFEATGDFNGDGKTDLVWRNERNGFHFAWHMDGGTVIDRRFISRLTDWRLVTTDDSFDVNTDGRTDLLWRNTRTGQNVLWMLGSDGFRPERTVVLGGGRDWQIVAAGSTDGQARPDADWRPTSGADIVWYLDQTGRVTARSSLGPGGNRSLAGLDTSGQGRTELFWRFLGRSTTGV